MEMSHVISDLILGLVGVFVFFRYLLKLELFETIMWESFVLSVALAALFGAGKFAGIEQAGLLSSFFQNLAATAGALGLAAAAWFKVQDESLDRNVGIIVLAVGFILFAVHQTIGMPNLVQHIPVVSMILVIIAAFMAFLKGKVQLGLWLLAGVLFAALATFRHLFIENEANGIDVYHYLLALSLLSFGVASSKD